MEEEDDDLYRKTESTEQTEKIIEPIPNTPKEEEGEMSESSDDDLEVVIDNDEPPQKPKSQTVLPVQALQPTAVQQVQQKGIDLGSVGQYQGKDIFDVEIDGLDEKPWRQPGADLTDYFNYGFNENTWKVYCAKQRHMRDASMMQMMMPMMPPPFMHPAMMQQMKMKANENMQDGDKKIMMDGTMPPQMFPRPPFPNFPGMPPFPMPPGMMMQRPPSRHDTRQDDKRSEDNDHDDDHGDREKKRKRSHERRKSGETETVEKSRDRDESSKSRDRHRKDKSRDKRRHYDDDSKSKRRY